MTRKSTAKPTNKPAAKKKPPEPERVTAYVVVRRLPSDNNSFTEPERVFASKAAAQELADERNRELRTMVNPFERNLPDDAISGGDTALLALLKKLQVTAPKAKSGYSYIDWASWWDASYFDVTAAQHDAIWDALDKFARYEVKATKVE